MRIFPKSVETKNPKTPDIFYFGYVAVEHKLYLTSAESAKSKTWSVQQDSLPEHDHNSYGLHRAHGWRDCDWFKPLIGASLTTCSLKLL